MVVDDIQFLSALKGKRIKITLKDASYFGNVQRINSNKTIVLADVVGAENGTKYSGSKMFFGSEIVNVEFTDKDDNATRTEESGQEDRSTVQRSQPYRSRAEGLDEHNEEFINFVVIDEFHENFWPAVMHIKKQQVIGVGADGVGIYQHGRLSWLQIATKHKVFLFDILQLGERAFKNGLSMILQSQHILKIIHDCRAVASFLSSQFGVNVTKVFDTQVADVLCFYSETGGLLPDRVSTLQEVINLHLKVPTSQLLSLQMKTEISQEKEMWCKRPCPLPLLKVMALSVIHLQPLRLVLLDTLMTDYMLLVDSYLNSNHYQPDELERIGMENVLELPKELRQLEKMRCDRRVRAAEQFPVTEQGLLDRFNPRLSKGATEESQQDPLKPVLECKEASLECKEASLGCKEASLECKEASLECKEASLECKEASSERAHSDSLNNPSNNGTSPWESPVRPGIGRGLFVRRSPAQDPGGSPTNSENGKNEPRTAPKSLPQSFRSFRD